MLDLRRGKAALVLNRRLANLETSVSQIVQRDSSTCVARGDPQEAGPQLEDAPAVKSETRRRVCFATPEPAPW